MMPLPSDRLSSPVGNGKDKPNTDESSSPHSTHQGLIQLCVIVEKDESGYGLTVSGDKPVHVQSVRENGASARAGVMQGDRIYKVNGQSVASFDHTEVVARIKAGSHVALTLLRKPEALKASLQKLPPSPGPNGGLERITAPLPINPQQEQQVVREKVEMVKRMLEEAMSNEAKLQADNAKSKSAKVQDKLADVKKTISVLRQQLESLTGLNPEHQPNNALRPRNSICMGEIQGISSDSSSPFPAMSMPASVDIPDNCAPRSPAPPSVLGDAMPCASFDDTDDEAVMKRLNSNESQGGLSSLRLPDIINMEDDDVSGGSSSIVKDHGPFNNLEQLKSKRAHCSVFLSFLLSNHDPAPMLFSLITDLYQTGTLNDMKRWAYEIHSTFLVKDAPLAIKLDEDVVSSVEYILSNKSDREDQMKTVFHQPRNTAVHDINEYLCDFRTKREMGLMNFYGDGEPQEDWDMKKELQYIERTLVPQFDKFTSDQSPRSQALSMALATVMKEWGIHRGLDRTLSFAMRENKRASMTSLISSKLNKKSKEQIKNHNFVSSNYQTTTLCVVCRTPLWGIGFQGYKCSHCNLNCHKECLNQVDPCSKTKGSKRGVFPQVGGPKMSKTSSASSQAAFIPEVPELPTSQQPGSQEEEVPAHSVAELKKRFEMSQLGNGTEEVEKPAETAPSVAQQQANVGRSESFNKKKTDNGKSKDSRRAKSDVDKNNGEVLKAIDQSRSSSSASSLSNNDSSSTDLVGEVNERPSQIAQVKPPSIEETDSDLEVEESLPSLKVVIPKDVLRKMKPKEKKLQEVINELIYTEKSHVRNLKLLDLLFHKPMSKADFCKKELIDLVFPDLTSLINVHASLSSELKERAKIDPVVSIKDVAKILLRRFDDKAGAEMMNLCASFCRDHTFALNVLEEKRKREAKLHDLLSASETNPLCRRLLFKDLILAEVQRLTNYPLLIDSLCKYTTSVEDSTDLVKAGSCSRDILNHVNQAVKDCENLHKLSALQKRLDTKPIQNSTNPLVVDYKNLDLTLYKLIYDGPLTWRMGIKKQLELHVVLFDEILVLLQKQDDGKLALKCQSQLVVAGNVDSKFTHSPIITLNTLLTRQVATDKKAFFIINTSQLGPQIYDLVASTQEEKKRWFKYISEAAESQKKNPQTRKAPKPAPIWKISSVESTANNNIEDLANTSGFAGKNGEMQQIEESGELPTSPSSTDFNDDKDETENPQEWQNRNASSSLNSPDTESHSSGVI